MVGPGKSGLGHPGWRPNPGVSWQWRQSQLSDASLCPLTWVHPISELDHSLNPFWDHIPLVGLGGGRIEPTGFTLMRVQIEGMPHNDEQQVVFVLDDPSGFSARIPVILGTPTINRVVQTMKESEIHNAPSEWQAARVTFEWTQGFQFWWASLAERLKFLTNTAEDPLDLDEKVLLTDKCTIPGFQSIIAHGHTQSTMMMGHQLNVMMQVPYPDDKTDLFNGLYVMRTYTEDGSWSVSVVLWNLTARPIHLAWGRVVGRVVAANAVPDAQCSSDLLKKLDNEDPDRPEPVKLSTQQRQDLLLATLQKDGGLDRLKEWPPDLAQKAVALLLEFNHVFSLEPNEIRCTDATEHVIELMKDEPFKERFRRIPWWMKYASISRRCWTVVPSDPPSGHGAMPWCWWGRRMGHSSFASTFVTLTPGLKRTPTPCRVCKRPWRAWLVPNTFLAWTWRVGSGKSKWPKSPDNTLPSWWETWACMSSYACPTGYATPWQRSNISCKTVWGS